MHPASDPSADCTCEAAWLAHAWCRRCNIGYVAGERIVSARLFETLDPHGHRLDRSQITCAWCRQAMSNDGFCETCRIGYVGGLAYFTRLTHAIARGTTRLPNDSPCSECFSNGVKAAWCDHSATGRVGNVFVQGRDSFETMQREHQTLLAAIAKQPTCDFCACAIVVHRTCPTCLISYRDGVPTGKSAEPRTTPGGP